MPVLQKVQPKLRKPLAKELMNYGIHNEVRRYIGKGKKVVPRIIPFVNNKQLDITDALKAQGINPNTYTGTNNQQFDTPEGVTIVSGEVKKIPLKTPQDGLFYMNSVRYWAVKETSEEWPVVGKDATFKKKAYYYDKWNQTTNIALHTFSQITLAGSAAAPSEAVTPPASITAFDTKVLYDGLTFILPIYEDDVANPLIVDPTEYVQVQIANMAADGSTFDLYDMAGNAYTVNFAGEAPVLWPMCCGSDDYITPMYHFLKVALIANSPKRINIYGGLANVPAVNDAGQTLSDFSHVERLYASSLQGYADGYNQIERKHLFPMDATISVEIENIFDYPLLVNGYIFGYQIYSRAEGQL